MSTNLPTFAMPLQPLPVAPDDDVVAADLDVSLSTPMTVVVQARLESAGAGGPQSVDLSLVIPRSKCQGARPRLPALIDAARAAVARATRAGTAPLGLLPRRVVTYVAGRPHLVPVFD